MPLGVRMLVKVVDDLASGRHVQVEQDESLTSEGSAHCIGDRWALIGG